MPQETHHTIGNKFAENDGPVQFSQIQLKAAIDALDSWFASEKAGLGTLVDTAISPATMTNAQKKRLFTHWLEYRFKEEAL